MIISDLYRTEIYCNKYDVNIDTTDVVVVVRLTDFNGYPVTGKEVKLEVNKGKMTAVTLGSNGSITADGKRVTAKTNANGEMSVSYTADEFGICTFTANGNNVQINVGGYRRINLTGKSSVCYSFSGYIKYNPLWRFANIRISAHVKVTQPDTSVVITTIPAGYRPGTTFYVPPYHRTGELTKNKVNLMYIGSGGDVGVRRAWVPSTINKDEGYLIVGVNAYYGY